MAARKAPAKAATPDLPHDDACAEPRIESYEATRPDGSAARIERCQECGAQNTN